MFFTQTKPALSTYMTWEHTRRTRVPLRLRERSIGMIMRTARTYSSPSMGGGFVLDNMMVLKTYVHELLTRRYFVAILFVGAGLGLEFYSLCVLDSNYLPGTFVPGPGYNWRTWLLMPLLADFSLATVLYYQRASSFDSFPWYVPTFCRSFLFALLISTTDWTLAEAVFLFLLTACLWVFQVSRTYAWLSQGRVQTYCEFVTFGVSLITRLIFCSCTIELATGKSMLLWLGKTGDTGESGFCLFMTVIYLAVLTWFCKRIISNYPETWAVLSLIILIGAICARTPFWCVSYGILSMFCINPPRSYFVGVQRRVNFHSHRITLLLTWITILEAVRTLLLIVLLLLGGQLFYSGLCLSAATCLGMTRTTLLFAFPRPRGKLSSRCRSDRAGGDTPRRRLE